VLWGATLVGNIGVWMREVGSGWLMTELAPSPLMVSLVQVAATLPIFIFSLPAGALSDLVNRRRLMIGTQAASMVIAIAMALLTLLGAMTPAILLVCVVLASTGTAVSAPVWQSIVPELVGKEQLRSAVALNSLGINIARAIGPAAAGALIVTSGVAAAFFADALTYVVVLAALLWWRSDTPRPTLPPEHLLQALLGAIRYARASRPLKRTLLRALLFFGFGSAPWALLPLLAREDLGGSAAFYGLMLAGIGAGAVSAALLLPTVRERLTADRLVLAATLLLSAAGMGLAFTDNQALALVLTPVLGLAWVTVLTSLNVTVQAILPGWVRGRGLAFYLTVFFGAMAAGSLVWGQVAQLSSTQTSLGLAASLGAAAAIAAIRLPLPTGEDDLSPSHHWPDVAGLATPEADAGPVMVMIEYRVAPAHAGAFRTAIEALGTTRRRDGAYAWGVFRDAEDHERHVEYFLVESWVAHLRQHERVSIADEPLQAAVRALHKGASPRATHLIAISSPFAPAPAEQHNHI
jgi:MFS family permease